VDLQYISDENGKHTAVVIPIEDWNKILNIHEDLKKFESQKNKLSDKYSGKISNKVADNINHYISKSRKEWNDI